MKKLLRKINSVCTNPLSKETTIIDLHIYEVDSWDGRGIIDDDTISDIYKDEKEKGDD